MKLGLLSVAVVLLSSALAHASLYEERARQVQIQNQNAEIARVNRHYDAVERRFMANFEAFAKKYGPFQGTPECRDRNATSGSARGSRQACGSSLCVNVLGSSGDARYETSVISVDVYRKYEMIQSCEVTIRNGLPCSVGYIHGRKDGWMVGFGGTCIDSQNQVHQVQVPFRNIKFD